MKIIDRPLDKPLDSTPDAELIVETRSEFQHIQILKHPVYGHQLVIDGDLQISESDYAYNTAMTAPLLTLPICERVAILGGGDGGVLQEALRVLNNDRSKLQQITMVDIDEAVMRLCHEYLPLLCSDSFHHEKAQIIIGDAFGYIAREKNLDAVIYDLTMNPARAGQSRIEFIEEILGNIAKSLRPGGVISMQCCGQYEETESKEQDRLLLLEQIQTVARQHFNGLTLQEVLIPSFHEKWTFLAAIKPN